MISLSSVDFEMALSEYYKQRIVRLYFKAYGNVAKVSFCLYCHLFTDLKGASDVFLSSELGI